MRIHVHSNRTTAPSRCHHYRPALPATVSSRVKVVPLSHEVIGSLGKPASLHLNLLGNIAASTGVVDKSAFIDQALREIARQPSVATMKLFTCMLRVSTLEYKARLSTRALSLIHI